MPDLTPLARHEAPELDLPAGLAVTAGAVLGALAGYLLLTRRGARLRQELDEAVDGWFAGVESVVAGWQRARRHLGSPTPTLPFDDAEFHAPSPEQSGRRRAL